MSGAAFHRPQSRFFISKVFGLFSAFDLFPRFLVGSSRAIALFLKQYFVAGCGTWVIFNRLSAADFSQATFVSQN
jgi:hypothetical protein